MTAPSLAFPFHLPEEMVYDTGMLLRDYFAAAALTGLLGIPTVKEPIEQAYIIADEMMKQRLK